MTLKQRVDAFTKLGAFMRRHCEKQWETSEMQLHEGLDHLTGVAFSYNGWFIPEFTTDAIFNLGAMLNPGALGDFASRLNTPASKTVAVICAGNIPLVGFHDVLCVLLSGHRVLIKLSTDDKVLLPFFLKLLCHYEPAFEERILFADGKLGAFDAIIATGSDNTASHLHYYFGKYPHIIRKSRSSLAVLTGNETADELRALGKDIFQYFGLGCRNVSQLLVPKDYSFDAFFEAIVDFGFVVNNKKYGNNYDYHRAIYLLETIPFLDNNFLMLRESPTLHSPVGTVHFTYYENDLVADAYIATHREKIQCVIGRGHIPFGYSQTPVISDFADNVNTLDFLVNLEGH